jgi:aminoglycoside phosphotransferase (APT) family kinase protein
MNEFELFTNTEAMRARFQQQLPGFSQDELSITSCRVLRTRYKSLLEDGSRHRSFLFIHYELEVAGPGGDRLGAQQLFAKAYLKGRSQLKFRQVSAAGLAQPRFGEPLVHLPDLGLIVWAFPNDPELPHLSTLVDGARVKPYLPYDQLPAGFNAPEEIGGVGVEVVRYKPEVRCTIRYHLRRRRPTGTETLTIYGKTYATDRGAEAYRHIRDLWQRSQTEPGQFTYARPLGYYADMHMIWQEALAGSVLSNVLSAKNFDEFLPLAAQGLAGLHRSGLMPLRQVSPAGLLAEIGESAAELIAAMPDVRARLQRLWARVEQDAPPPAAGPPRVIHRDFHVKQLLVHADGPGPALAIFDFDDLALGDPLQDIAFFIVDLYCREFEPSLVERMAASFCQAYQAQTGTPLDAGRLHWHLRLQLLAKAHWYYKKKQLSPRLAAHVHRILALAEQEALFVLE